MEYKCSCCLGKGPPFVEQACRQSQFPHFDSTVDDMGVMEPDGDSQRERGEAVVLVAGNGYPHQLMWLDNLADFLVTTVHA